MYYSSIRYILVVVTYTSDGEPWRVYISSQMVEFRPRGGAHHNLVGQAARTPRLLQLLRIFKCPTIQFLLSPMPQGYGVHVHCQIHPRLNVDRLI